MHLLSLDPATEHNDIRRRATDVEYNRVLLLALLWEYPSSTAASGGPQSSRVSHTLVGYEETSIPWRFTRCLLLTARPADVGLSPHPRCCTHSAAPLRVQLPKAEGFFLLAPIWNKI